MRGNVWEWCQDAFQADYVGAPADGSASDVADPDPTGELGNPNPPLRVLRGGAWLNPADMRRSAYRLRRWPYMRSAYIGFRVVVEAE
jgi:formylglycine-generating enzyme required for sulfatase activity